MNTFIRSKPKMTRSQRKAEREAVRLLIEAQHLLTEDVQNADRALQLRNKAVLEILPSHRLYIAAKHPNSLLRDVDHRISKAFSEKFWREKQAGLEGVDSESKKINIALHKRFDKANQRAEKNYYTSIMWLLFLAVSFVSILLLMQHYSDGNTFANTFQWITR